jgi:hypothetical protein
MKVLVKHLAEDQPCEPRERLLLPLLKAKRPALTGLRTGGVELKKLASMKWANIV